jgi:hypothetical protein
MPVWLYIFPRGHPLVSSNTSLNLNEFLRSLSLSLSLCLSIKTREALTRESRSLAHTPERAKREGIPTMVFYFKARSEVGDYTIFMGLDKFENEELIKYGFPEDIWYPSTYFCFLFSPICCSYILF